MGVDTAAVFVIAAYMTACEGDVARIVVCCKHTGRANAAAMTIGKTAVDEYRTCILVYAAGTGNVDSAALARRRRAIFDDHVAHVVAQHERAIAKYATAIRALAAFDARFVALGGCNGKLRIRAADIHAAAIVQGACMQYRRVVQHGERCLHVCKVDCTTLCRGELALVPLAVEHDVGERKLVTRVAQIEHAGRAIGVAAEDLGPLPNVAFVLGNIGILPVGCRCRRGLERYVHRLVGIRDARLHHVDALALVSRYIEGRTEQLNVDSSGDAREGRIGGLQGDKDSILAIVLQRVARGVRDLPDRVSRLPVKLVVRPPLFREVVCEVGVDMLCHIFGNRCVLRAELVPVASWIHHVDFVCEHAQHEHAVVLVVCICRGTLG